MRATAILLILLPLLCPTVRAADTAAAADAAGTAARDSTSARTDECLKNAVLSAPKHATAQDIRDWCSSQRESDKQRAENALRSRLALEHNARYNPFVLTPHERNYLMPWSWWSNRTWNDPSRDNGNLQPNEVKFQLSLKAPLVDHLFGNNTLYFAFTMTSFWQAYNRKISRPFRETDYKPELFIARPIDVQLGPIDSELVSFGYMHQSNGRSTPTSRSWDRLFVRYVFRTGAYYWTVEPWYRLPERRSAYPGDPTGDDNPDITKYMGNFQLDVARPFGHHVVDLMLRNNLRKDNKGAAQIDYTFPLTERFKGIVQVFTGYGDSLINYNDYENRFSVGILLTDTL